MKAVILCNGEQPLQTQLDECLAGAELFIACDGAAHLAHHYGRIPDIIIGDMDSLDPELLSHPDVRHIADQNSNDLEKALDLAITLGVTQVDILGASGLRFDHFLTNLYILPRFARQMALSLHDSYGKAWIAGPLEKLEAPPKTPVSLFALGEHPVTKLTLVGLQYPLSEATLAPGSPRASLNCMADYHAHITHDEGVLLIYMAKL